MDKIILTIEFENYPDQAKPLDPPAVAYLVGEGDNLDVICFYPEFEKAA